jgi:hypothetical protein
MKAKFQCLKTDDIKPIQVLHLLSFLSFEVDKHNFLITEFNLNALVDRFSSYNKFNILIFIFMYAFACHNTMYNCLVLFYAQLFSASTNM